jgi:hypothetical protein
MVSRTLAIGVFLSCAAVAPAQTSPQQVPPTGSPVSQPTPRIVDATESSPFQGWFQNDASTTDSARVTVGAEYLIWWLKTDRPPQPLLTTGGAGGGVLGEKDTSVLFRLSDLDKDLPYNGGQFDLGVWFSRDDKFGLDASFFFLQQRSFSYGANSNSSGAPLLSVPYFDLNPAFNSQSVSQVSVPGVLVGSFDASSTTRLWGTDLDFKANLWRTDSVSVNGLLGFRQMDLRETLTLSQNEKAIVGFPLLSYEGTTIPASDSLAITDRFDTHNVFYGCDLGVKTTWSPFSRFEVEVTTKIAFGSVSQTNNTSGNTTHLNSNGGVVESDASGLFAISGLNAGNVRQYPFAVLPEAALRLRYSITNWMEISAGYDFLYLSSVIRPGDQVSSTINSSFAPSQVPYANGGPLVPAPSFRRTDFSAQGATLGLEFRF